LVHLEERFRENSESVSADVLDRHLESVRCVANDLEGLTFFEVMNAAFWLWVCELQPDMILLETGLGGRLDTTTICHPTLKILTLLDRDHVALLGRQVSQIADEKLAALIPSAPAVIGVQASFLEAQIQRCLSAKQVSSVWVAREARWTIEDRTPDAWSIRLMTPRSPERAFSLNLLGDHQVQNFAAAFCAFEQLGCCLPDGEGTLAIQANWMGRCQLLETPVCRWVVDGSHTALSGQALRKVLDQTLPGECMREFWVACSKDRFPWCYLRGLVRPQDRIILVDYRHPRLWLAADLKAALMAEAWDSFPLPNLTISSVDGIRKAGPMGGPRVACGSLYWAGYVLNSWGT
jgi:dihydrofolate synthase/folylpolyglutamate synthase